MKAAPVSKEEWVTLRTRTYKQPADYNICSPPLRTHQSQFRKRRVQQIVRPAVYEQEQKKKKEQFGGNVVFLMQPWLVWHAGAGGTLPFGSFLHRNTSSVRNIPERYLVVIFELETCNKDPRPNRVKPRTSGAHDPGQLTNNHVQHMEPLWRQRWSLSLTLMGQTFYSG